MKKQSVGLLLLCLTLLLQPARAGAAQVRNIFSDVTATLSERMDEWLMTAAQMDVRDLDITLTCDKETLCQDESATLRVTLINPRMRSCAVTFGLTLSHQERFDVERLDMAQEGEAALAQEEVLLPAAQMAVDGSVTPGTLERVYRITMRPVGATDEGVVDVTAAATMREGSRWYQQARDITLCAPRLSAVLRASSETLAPQEHFYYEVSIVNSGGAAGEAPVTLTLPEGISYSEKAEWPPAVDGASAGEAQEIPAAAVSDAQGPISVQGRTVSATVNVPAARFDEQGELLQAGQSVLRVPVQVDANALYQTPSAVKTLLCGATMAETRLQAKRITVRGPIITCTLTPSVEDVQMGGVLSYTCELKNSGYTPADVRVTFHVPEGMRFARFVTRGQQNKVAGDTLSWVVHLDAAEFDLSGKAIPEKTQITYQVRTTELEEGVRALLVPATAIYQVGEGEVMASQTALTTVHRPAYMGLTGEEWFLLFWAGVVLILTAVVLFVLIRRDDDKVR